MSHKPVGIHETPALADYLPQILAYRALVAGQPVYWIALAPVPKEQS